LSFPTPTPLSAAMDKLLFLVAAMVKLLENVTDLLLSETLLALFPTPTPLSAAMVKLDEFQYVADLLLSETLLLLFPTPTPLSAAMDKLLDFFSPFFTAECCEGGGTFTAWKVPP